MNDTQNEDSKGKNRGIEMLDVEDEEHRQERMHDLFMQLDSKTAARPQDGLRTFDFGDRKTFMVEPPSELLSRVEAFLPQFAASTAEIARRAQEDPDSVDIEKLGNEDKYIQMNLGLGVFEERRGSSSSPAGDSDTEMHESETSANSTSTSTSDSDSDSESSDSESSDEYDSDSSVDIISSAVAMASYRPIRPLPRRKSTRPQIVVLGDTAMKEDHGSSSSSSSGETPV